MVGPLAQFSRKCLHDDTGEIAVLHIGEFVFRDV